VAQELIMEARNPKRKKSIQTKLPMPIFFGCSLQVNGLHRLYNGKWDRTLWLCTFGLFGVGQLVDLFLIPNMVDEYNKLKAKCISTNASLAA